MTRRILTLLTLLGWAGFMLWFRASGRIAAYLHPQFHAWVAMAGIVLLGLAPLWWWASGKDTGGCAHCACDHHGHDHDNHRTPLGAGAFLGFALLILPVAAASVISPGEFGVAAVMNRGIVTDVSQLPSARPSFGTGWQDAPMADDTEGIPDVQMTDGEEGVEYFTRRPDGAIELQTLDLLFAAEEPALRDQFENQRVALVGQYVPPQGGEGGGFDLVRMFVICCAADARPLGINVVAPQIVEVPRMGWVRITGVARFVEKDGRLEPKLEAEQIEQVEAPQETFLYR